MKLKICILAAVLTAASSSFASEWTGNASSDWTEPSNWTAGVPTAGTSPARISTNNPNPTEIDGQPAETGSNFGLGYNGTGALTIINGGTLNSVSANLGSQPAGNGSVTISGSGSIWEIASGNFDIGWGGTGQIEILDGGLLETPSSRAHVGRQATAAGSVIVSGAGSLWEHQDSFWLGVLGSGQMTISDGGQVVFSGTSTLAQNNDSTGEVTITGAGSTLRGTRLHVGNGATSGTTMASGLLQLADGGTLELTGSGMPANYRLIIASNSRSEGTVNIGAPSSEPPVAPGELVLTGGIGFSNGTGTLVFNHTGLLDMDFPVTGPNTGAAHIQVEAGVNLFSGAALDYGGTTFIATDAVFGAFGQLGPVENQGRFVAAPGSTAAVSMVGDYVHGPDGVLAFNIGPGPAVSQIEISGQAQLQGGSIELMLLPGDYGNTPLDGVYPVLTAAGGINGDVPALESSNPNAFALFVDGDTLFVEIFDRLFEDRYQE